MRIKINGSGSCSAISTTAPDQNWERLSTGTTGFHFDEDEQLFVGKVPEAIASRLATLDQKWDRAALLAILAGERALQSAGWIGTDFGVLCGCSRGPTHNWEHNFIDFYQGERLGPKTSPLTTLGSIGFALAQSFGTSSISDGLSVTCSSGFHAILHAIALLQAGMIDRVMAGGAEAPISPFTLEQFRAMRILSGERGTTYPCRPIAIPTGGMIIGEGSGMFCLSTETVNPGEVAILGIGFAREQSPSLSGITPDGSALASAMESACAMGERLPDLILPHAPGTERGDQAEMLAIRGVFPNDTPPVYSAKWATGHTFAASGPQAMDLAIHCLRSGSVPALPYQIGHEMREWHPGDQLRTVLINATGFGGNAISVLLGLV